MENQVLSEFKKHAIFRLNESQRMIHLALAKVNEEQLWQIPVSNGLRLGNQLLHLCGNMTQYLIASLGEKTDERKRDEEFTATGRADIRSLLTLFDNTVKQAINTIEEAPESAFTRIRKVQDFEFSGVGVVLHAVEHCSYHTGQIAFWVKQLTAADLGFYDQHDLNQLNE